MLTLSLIQDKRQNAMAKSAVRSYTVAQFKAKLDHARASQFVGPEGTQEEELPYKDGAAFVPAIMDWAAPQCTCMVDKPNKDRPNRKAVPFNIKFSYNPELRHRAKRHVLSSSQMIMLDADNQTKPEIFAALDRMEADGLDFSAWSTHSYGRKDKGEKCPARVAVYTSDTIDTEAMPLIRVALAEKYGITLDRAANTPITLFYLPSCPDSPGRKALAWVRHSTRTELVSQASLFGKGASRTLERLKERKETRLLDLKAHEGTASEEHKKAAVKDLSNYVNYVATHTDEHIRQTLLGCYRFGAYSACGALPPLAEVEKLLQDALEKRYDATGDDNYANHVELIRSSLNYGAEEPFLPDMSEDSEGIEALQQQLDEGLDFKFIPAATVSQTITDILSVRPPNELTVLVVTAGGGKTHAILEDMKLKRSHGQASLLLAPRHDLITQLMQRVGGLSARHRSAAVIIEGEDNCLWENNAVFPKLAARHGLNIRRDVCGNCPRKDHCNLYKKPKADERLVHFGAHQLPLVAVTSKHPDVTVYVDEMPELRRKSEATTEDMALPLDTSNLDVTGAHALIQLHTHWLNNTKPDAWEIPSALVAEVKLVKYASPEVVLMHKPTLRTLRVLQALRIWAAGEAIGEKVVLTDLALHLKNQGGVQLTATPDRRTLLELGAKMYDLHVADAHPEQTTRLVLYRCESTRRYVAPKGKLDAPKVDKAIRDALVMARDAGNKTVLLVSYMKVLEGLDKAALAIEYGFKQLDFAYYGNLTGMDHWKKFDAFVTVFDPYPPALSFEHARDLARGELAQAHGRARDPNRHNGAWHLHVGTLGPYEWYSDNTQIVRLRAGRPPKIEPPAKRRRKDLFKVGTGK